MIEDTMNEEAWQEISTEFSPVYERGAQKTLTRTSSMVSPSGEWTDPNFMVYPSDPLIDPLRHLMTLSAIVRASGPLTLITEIAPVPGIVAGAHIVSSFRIYISSRVLYVAAKLPLSKDKSKFNL